MSNAGSEDRKRSSSSGIYDDAPETSLWDVAFESLGEADQTSLGFAEAFRSPTPSKLVKSIEEAKEECEQKQWIVFTNKQGKDIKFHDVLGGIVDWVNKFKEIGDAAVQYDPAHAALPWAAVKFFLQMAVNDCQTFGDMLEGIEKVSGVVATYTDLETRILLRQSALTRQLSAALVNLYGAVLRFLAQAHRYYTQRTIKRILRAAFQSPKSVVEQPILIIEQYETTVFRLCSLVQNECTGSSLADLMGLIRDNFTQSERKLEDRRLQLAAWINGVDTRNTYESALKYRHDGTCDWVLRLEEMKKWRSKESTRAKLFWLHGPPGFGKTIASAWTIQNLKKTEHNSIAYFFCVAENRLTQDPYSILRSWIAQLLDQNHKVVALMESAFAKRRTKDQTLSQLELWELFVLIGQSKSNYTLVVDGFDECTHIDSGTKYHMKDARNHFLRDLITYLPNTDFRVMVVSRDMADIREYLDPNSAKSNELEMTEYGITAKDNSADINSFSEDMVNRRLPNKDLALRDSLIKSAVDRSEGMFLWIKLLENEISPGYNASQLRRTIVEMPVGVSEAYSRELDRILKLPPESRSAVLVILRWVLFAVRPLQLKELAEALAVSDLPDEADRYPRHKLPDTWDTTFVDEDYVNETILARCGSFVQVRATSSEEALASRSVHLVHFSVKEYLLSLPDAGGLVGTGSPINVVEEETRLSHICLRYLSLPPFSESLPDIQVYPFLLYAAWAWYFHSYKRKMETSAETIARTKRVFHPSTGSWKVWSPVMELKLYDEWKLNVGGNGDESESQPQLKYANDATVASLVNSEPRQTESSTIQNPLYYASLLGIEEIVRWLEDQGLDCNCAGGRYGYPLQAAVVGKHEAIIKHLLNRNADVNQRGGHFKTALLAAVTISTPEIVRILIEAGADVRAIADDSSTALHNAAHRGDVNIVNRLIDAGALVDAKCEAGNTPLHIACIAGWKEVVHALRSRGADLEMPNQNGARAIQLAIRHGHEDLACYLVEANVSLSDSQDTSKEGSSFLLLLALKVMAGTELIRKLIKRKFNLNGKFSRGWTLMHQAANRATPDAIKLLIDAGGDLRAIDDHGRTPILIATMCGQKDTLKYVLEHIKGSTETFWGEITPLLVSTINNNEEIVRQLLDFGLSVQYIYEDDQYTLYDIAIKNGSLNLAKIFVERGCFRGLDANQKSGFAKPGVSPEKDSQDRLACLAFLEDYGSVKQALERAPEKFNGSDLAEALRAASARGSYSIIQLLVQEGADVNAKDATGRTSLHHALFHGRINAADFLVSKGASLTAVDSVGSTPIDLAVKKGQINVDFVKRHMTDLSLGISRRASLSMSTTRRDRQGAAMTALQIRKAIAGTWEGHYEYLSWRKGKQGPMSIHVADVVSPAARKDADTSDPFRAPILGFWSDKEEDSIGKFHFYGFVDPIGIIWFVKLYRRLGWLYRGQLDDATGIIKGTWGSNRQLWHGMFELRKATPGENDKTAAV